jgi:hypothetical protein
MKRPPASCGVTQLVLHIQTIEIRARQYASCVLDVSRSKF